MEVRSMTAYASVCLQKNSQDIQVVLKSNNFKYLDISVHNLPVEEILMEEKIKREIKSFVHRGRVEVFVFFEKMQANSIGFNERVVFKYVSQARSLAKKYGIDANIRMGEILSLPQVIVSRRRKGENHALVIAALKEALAMFMEFKKKEGALIKKEILANLKKLKSHVQKIKTLKPKINKMENGKEDIDEELSLIGFYIGKLENKIKEKRDVPKGKAMDFLTQEILRELNAASSKTKKKAPALLIVESKNYLERIREQSQNVE